MLLDLISECSNSHFLVEIPTENTPVQSTHADPNCTYAKDCTVRVRTGVRRDYTL